MRKKPLQQLNPKQVFELNDTYYQHIGKIIFQYSCIEIITSNLVYMSLNLNESLGRLAVRASRPQEKLKDFENICKISNLTYFPTQLEKLSNGVSWLKPKRDSLAHTKWMEKSPQIEKQHDFLIMRTTGGWNKKDAKEIGFKPRVIVPQAQTMTVEQLQSVSDTAEVILTSAKDYLFKFAEANPECASAFLRELNGPEAKVPLSS